MTTEYTIGHERSDAAQATEHDEDGFEVVEETSELRPSVDQSIQAKVDHADDERLNGRLFGQTLAEEEQMQAREWEIGRTRLRMGGSDADDRAARTRTVVREVSVERQQEFKRRAASVDPMQDPELADPRERLAQDELAAVNREAARIANRLDGWARAAVSRLLAERVLAGTDLASAVVGVVEALEAAPGRVIPIAAVEDVTRTTVSIEGQVSTLWEPSHPKIQQVGLVEDESGRIKVTVWKRSRQPWMAEGERVVLRNAAVSWYQGRASVALTGWSQVHFPERDPWWGE